MVIRAPELEVQAPCQIARYKTGTREGREGGKRSKEEIKSHETGARTDVYKLAYIKAIQSFCRSVPADLQLKAENENEPRARLCWNVFNTRISPLPPLLLFFLSLLRWKIFLLSEEELVFLNWKVLSLGQSHALPFGINGIENLKCLAGERTILLLNGWLF